VPEAHGLPSGEPLLLAKIADQAHTWIIEQSYAQDAVPEQA
jgi:hypothetical protein